MLENVARGFYTDLHCDMLENAALGGFYTELHCGMLENVTCGGFYTELHCGMLENVAGDGFCTALCCDTDRECCRQWMLGTTVAKVLHVLQQVLTFLLYTSDTCWKFCTICQ